MEAEHCTFLAENTLVQIKPNFNDQVLHLICGDVGPFEAGMPVSVPLWVAINLKRRHKCEIIPPEWMDIEEIKRMIVAETESPFFTEIPPYFFEISHLLLENAVDDIAETDQVKTFVQDLWDKRVAKMRTSTMKFLSQFDSCHAQLNDVTQLEIAYAKPSILASMARISELHSNFQKLTPS
ncbi:hypothetical protein AB6A40_004872 [Gnathostoma spinigerum]|uniref:DNA replication complex GINS protein PSF2 n=1 Tax=Gnathostoma spinigerum TaxID=75299 RepID=A0ABD6EMH8_9BILA